MLYKASQVCDDRIQAFSTELSNLLLKYQAELYAIGGAGLMLIIDNQTIPEYDPKNYTRKV